MKQLLAFILILSVVASCVSPGSILPTDEGGVYALALDYDAWARTNAERDDASYVDEVLVPRVVERLGIPLDAEDRATALREYASGFTPTQRSNTLALVFMARVPEVRDRVEAAGLTFAEVSSLIEAMLSTASSLSERAGQ